MFKVIITPLGVKRLRSDLERFVTITHSRYSS